MGTRSYVSTSELASALGVSRQTLSAVLNGTWQQRRISRETFERVSSAVAESGFVPQKSATALRRAPSGLTGVIYHGDLYSHILSAVQELTRFFNCTGRPVKMVLTAAEGLKGALCELLGERVERVVIVNTRNAFARELAAEVPDTYLGTVPTIIYNFPFGHSEDQALDKDLIGRGVSLVGFSRIDVYAQLFEAVIDSGRARRVLMESSTLDYLRLSPRTRALLDRLDSVAPYDSPGATGVQPDEFVVGEALAEKLAAVIEAQGIDLIVTDSDMQAQGMIARLGSRGIAVPGGVGVVGFDDIKAAPYFRVPLTTIRVPVTSMVRDVERLLEREEAQPAQALSSRAAVVWRESFRVK